MSVARTHRPRLPPKDRILCDEVTHLIERNHSQACGSVVGEPHANHKLPSERPSTRISIRSLVSCALSKIT